MTRTAIEWADEVWNPTVGCTRVSPGCDHCYAFELHDRRYAANRQAAQRLGAMSAVHARSAGSTSLPFPAQYDRPFSAVQLLPDRFEIPLRRRKPTRYFVDSMSDLFHEDVPDDYIDRVFAVMALAQQHEFLILTKRPERMRAHLSERMMPPEVVMWVFGTFGLDHLNQEQKARLLAWADTDDPPPNVWLGVSAEDQERADERIPILLDTPAAVRFVSAEPLLGPIDILPYMTQYVGDAEDGERYVPLADPGLHWIIVGGESGKHARPCDLAWIRSIRDQAQAAGVALFVKQLGAEPVQDFYRDESGAVYPTGDAQPISLRHGHGGNPEEWPEDLRIREDASVADPQA